MIPLRLTVRNFMCYRDGAPTLDLDGIHVACLCGQNGHGKSALLDAITWALWGKSRAKSDDDLIHFGEAFMEVELEFLSQGSRYKVIRKRTKGSPRRSGSTLLEFQVSSGEGFRPITGDRISTTEQKIRDLLRMNYDTFTNSAFLLQGKADLFTTKPPGERKRVLAEILELSYYDLLEERAKERARNADWERQSLEREIEGIKEELSHKGEYEEALKRLKEDLAGINGTLDAQRQVVEKLRSELNSLETKRSRLSEAVRDIEHYRREVEKLESQISQDRLDLEKSQQLINKSEEIERDFARFREVRQEKERFDSLLPKFSALSQKKTQLEGRIEASRREIAVQARSLSERMQEFSAKAAQLEPLRQGLGQAQKDIAQLEIQEQELTKRRETVQESYASIQQMKASQIQLRQEMDELRDKINRLGEGDAASCPLCGTPLGLEGKEKIMAHYEEEGKARKEKYLALDKQVKDQEKELRSQQQELDSWQRRQSQEMREKNARLATLQERIREDEKAEAEFPSIQVKHLHLLQSLENGAFALQERQELNEIASQTEKLGYNSDSHGQITTSYVQLRPVEEQYRKLQQVEERLPQLQTSLTNGESSLKSWKDLLQEKLRSKDALEGELKLLPEVRHKLDQAEESNKKLQSQRDEATRQMGSVERELDDCQKLEVELKEKERAWNRVAEDKGIYDELAGTFGKRGIQALIIETALPELEEEANRLLGRLTDNRMHLKIESQRDTKKGETVETLDIKISDELGTRNYELFSGGEAFRINFALRIALSRLLAHRAGAPLPVLFIDEGFGTQDATGREKLVECINSIQNDFEKIIVITHIDELKDMFPVRIEVVKTSEGSTFWIG